MGFIPCVFVFYRRNNGFLVRNIIELHSVFRSYHKLSRYKVIVKTGVYIFRIFFSIINSRVEYIHLVVILNSAS